MRGTDGDDSDEATDGDEGGGDLFDTLRRREVLVGVAALLAVALACGVAYQFAGGGLTGGWPTGNAVPDVTFEVDTTEAGPKVIATGGPGLPVRNVHVYVDGEYWAVWQNLATDQDRTLEAGDSAIIPGALPGSHLRLGWTGGTGNATLYETAVPEYHAPWIDATRSPTTGDA